MSIIKQLTPDNLKFSPATNSDFNWTRIQTLIHGPGASNVETATKNGDGNSAVFACLMAISMAYIEPPIKVYQKYGQDEYKELPEHPLQKLINMPTPKGALNQLEIQFWLAWAKHTDGNAYQIKVRAGNNLTGNVIETWPVSPTLMRPITIKGSRDFISYYELQVGPNKFEKIATNNVIHYRLGIDDRDLRMGLSPIKRLIRQIGTDEEADKFTNILFKNYAMPGLVVIPGENVPMDQDKADLIRTQFRRKFGGDNRGDVAVMSANADIKQFGFSPEQLNIDSLRDTPEERISAVMGIPAALAGLGAGLDRATYNNISGLAEYYTERKLVPHWMMDDEKLQTSLKPDFSSDPAIIIKRDLKNVRALQEDEDKKYTRLNLGVQGKWITKNEARSQVGFPPRPEYEESGDEEQSGDEEDNARKGVLSTNGHKGEPNGHGYPFRETGPFRADWQGYP